MVYPDNRGMLEILRVTFPFFLLMVLAVLLIWLFPGLVTALPERMRG